MMKMDFRKLETKAGEVLRKGKARVMIEIL